MHISQHRLEVSTIYMVSTTIHLSNMAAVSVHIGKQQKDSLPLELITRTCRSSVNGTGRFVMQH